jgi:predicted ATPase with chaperone activity
MVSRYQKRAGPLLDRIDIHVEVPRVEYDKLTDDRPGEPSVQVRVRVEKAREVQRQRFASANATGSLPFSATPTWGQENVERLNVLTLNVAGRRCSSFR